MPQNPPIFQFFHSGLVLKTLGPHFGAFGAPLGHLRGPLDFSVVSFGLPFPVSASLLASFCPISAGRRICWPILPEFCENAPIFEPPTLRNVCYYLGFGRIPGKSSFCVNSDSNTVLGAFLDSQMLPKPPLGRPWLAFGDPLADFRVPLERLRAAFGDLFGDLGALFSFFSLPAGEMQRLLGRPGGLRIGGGKKRFWPVQAESSGSRLEDGRNFHT